MSSNRRGEAARFVGRGPNGRQLCRCGCGREAPPPRKSWFSDECVHEWKIRNWPQYAREQVEKRDRGVCAVCGVDTEALLAPTLRSSVPDEPDLFEIAAKMGYRNEHDEQSSRYHWKQPIRADVKAAYEVACWRYQEISLEWRAFLHDYNEWLKAEGWPVGRHFWEADHIKPVVEGGGQCGLDNLRTLCIRCHKRATADLAARRARERRQKTQPELCLEVA